MGSAAFVGLNLIVVLAPVLLALWLGIRGVHALERSARANEQSAQRLRELTQLMGTGREHMEHTEDHDQAV